MSGAEPAINVRKPSLGPVILTERLGDETIWAQRKTSGANVERLAYRIVFAIFVSAMVLASTGTQATNVQFVGNVGYSYSGYSAVLTADKIQNFAAGGISGTLRMELWAFPSPFTGSSQSGYKLAQYRLGQLQGGYFYSALNSGSIPFGYPPNGTWYVSMLLTEYEGTSSVNEGYNYQDWVNMSQTLQVGPVSAPPGQIVVPSPYNFGTVTVGTSSGARAFTLTNVGGSAVNLTGLTSSLPAEFSVSVGSCGYIAAGGNCSFTISFNPSVVGAQSATITANGAPNSPQSFTVSGTGIAAGPPPGQLSMTSALGYGNVPVGSTSNPSTVTVTNVGGVAVSVSAISSSNPTEFPVTGTTCAVVSAGASCSFTFAFSPTSTGARSGVISVFSNGVASPKTISVSGTGVAATPPAASSIALTEYYHAGFDHYFITAIPDEIAKLDNGTFAGWVRTGLQIPAYAIGSSGITPTCRFFSAVFAPKSSHFYTPNAAECVTVQSNPNWQYEGQVFGVVLPDLAGNCPSGTAQLYRLYNNGQGGAPNHRYATSPSTRDNMVGRGWIPEGNGAAGVIACVPSAPAVASGTAEGMWFGSTNTGSSIIGVVLDSGTFYVLYTIPGTNTIAGVVQGAMSSANGQFSSSNARDFNFTGQGVYSATASGTYVAKSTLGGAIASTLGSASFSTVYQSQYEQPASLGALAGTYVGSAGTSLGWQPVTMTVSSSGAISGAASGCTFSGSAKPHGNVNVYDVSVTFGGGLCLFGTSTVTGLGYYDAATRTLYATAPSNNRADAFIAVGSK